MGNPLHAQNLAASLREPLRRADLDVEAFSRPLRPCRLEECRATCCHDGVIVPMEEAALLEGLASRHAERLESYGLELPVALFRPAARGRVQAATRSAAKRELAEDFPRHFSRRRCVFLDAEHRCGWQRLADDLGVHPWAFKPISCWMHPVILLGSGGVDAPRVLTLAGDLTDPCDFATHTPCGRPEAGGAPAREVLSRELDLLGQIAGRDFLGEMKVDFRHVSERWEGRGQVLEGRSLGKGPAI